MGELILTKSALAANSYYIEQASLNVYSLEELSFYIYNNAYMLDADFVNEALCDWIEAEVGDKLLASELRGFLVNGASNYVLIGHILNNNGYLTKKEIKQCLDIISSFDGKEGVEIKKLRADYMMKDDRFLDALFLYEMILDEKKDIEDVLKGNILHNMGYAHSKLFFFSKASECFEKAYRLNRNADSLELLLLSCLFAKDEESFHLYTNRYMVLPEDADRIKNKYLDCFEEDKNDKNTELFNRVLTAKDEVEKELILSEMLSNIKADYRSLRSY